KAWAQDKIFGSLPRRFHGFAPAGGDATSHSRPACPAGRECDVFCGFRDRSPRPAFVFHFCSRMRSSSHIASRLTGAVPPRSRMLSCLLAVLLTGMAQALVPRSEPVLRLQADGAFETAPDQTVRVGDTVVYRLRVSWNDIPAAVRLGPRTALEAPGFSVASTAVVHARTSRSGSLTGGDEPVVRTDYIY